MDPAVAVMRQLSTSTRFYYATLPTLAWPRTAPMFPLFDPREPIPPTIITAWPVCVPRLELDLWLIGVAATVGGYAACLDGQLGELVAGDDQPLPLGAARGGVDGRAGAPTIRGAPSLRSAAQAPDLCCQRGSRRELGRSVNCIRPRVCGSARDRSRHGGHARGGHEIGGTRQDRRGRA
jgi:hypothetical protein